MQTFYDELVFKVYFTVVKSRDIILWALLGVYCVYLLRVYKDRHASYILKIFTCVYLYSYILIIYTCI